ncbi:spore germination protein [Bacillus sp. Marseille-P3661]|uniref:spore germination protein n=1 Tax=Bacillus sp. Marseille-P3661 TaxID=1936234 RepID=UPI00215577E0|nr:spore germination protein [Bacillus sp. Marseille-P3661]
MMMFRNWEKAKQTNYKNSKSDQENPLLLSELDKNIKRYKELFGDDSDFSIRYLQGDNRTIAIMFIDSLVEKDTIDHYVIHPLNRQLTSEVFTFDNLILSITKLKELTKHKELVEHLLLGYTIILMDGQTRAYAAETTGGERRPVSESTVETVVRGPRESFNESMISSIGLIRKRLKTPKLKVYKKSIGKETKTSIAVLSIDGIAKDKIVKEVISRIDKLDIDGILESLYIEEMIEDPNGYTPFPTVFNSERPDRIAAGLLEGRIAIIVDGTPVVLLVPATIGLFLTSNEDYYQRYDFASFMKMLRGFTFILSFILPGLYVALLTYHQEMIPSPLLIAITGQREGVPFGIAIEIAIMEFTFEVLREAGLRLPKTVGAAVSIVGGLVLGQAAVEAGLVGQATVIAVSLTAICSFTTPSYNIAITARLIRFILLILSAVLGAFGLIFGLLLLFIHLNSLRSFSVPYLSPAVPFHKEDWKDLFIRVPWWDMNQRPDEITDDNQNRMPNPSEDHHFNGRNR